jgi:two-component system, NtrC family, response regulator AtoC
MKMRILVTDDDPVNTQFFADALAEDGYDVEQIHSGEEAVNRLEHAAYDLLVTDVRLPGISGLEVTRAVHHAHPDLPIVVMTGFGSMETAIEAIREGAFDYIAKPINLDELKQTISRALAQHALRREPRSHDGGEAPLEPASAIIGRSPAMVEVYKIIARAAPTKSTVLILGESGTGKELIAQAIHRHSPRAQRPFIAVDCGALTETLLESELFGHVRGSFTGAVADKKGVFEEAEGGSCFLDEIGDISANLQARLLRVLQEGEVRRVGAQKWSKVDVRVVAATFLFVAALVSKGAFREDLYYRLKVVTLQLPPLRERGEDVPVLAQHFLRRFSRESGKAVTSIADSALEQLRAYPWPGNIRELEHVIERAVALSNQPVLTSEDLPAEVRTPGALVTPEDLSPQLPSLVADLPTLEELKNRYIDYVLTHTAGNVSRAAAILGVDRRSLHRLRKRQHDPLVHDEE